MSPKWQYRVKLFPLVVVRATLLFPFLVLREIGEGAADVMEWLDDKLPGYEYEKFNGRFK